MVDNPCLRHASLSDVEPLCQQYMASSPAHRREHQWFVCVLRALYDAEWAKRGFWRSP